MIRRVLPAVAVRWIEECRTRRVLQIGILAAQARSMGIRIVVRYSIQCRWDVRRIESSSKARRKSVRPQSGGIGVVVPRCPFGTFGREIDRYSPWRDRPPFRWDVDEKILVLVLFFRKWLLRVLELGTQSTKQGNVFLDAFQLHWITSELFSKVRSRNWSMFTLADGEASFPVGDSVASA